jgi:hypothetical protein
MSSDQLAASKPDMAAKEEAVVATMLAECPDELPPCCARLLQHAPESFDDLRLANIAVAIRELRRAGKPIAPLTVREQLNGRLDDAGGALFLDNLAAQAAGISIAEFEATDLWEAYRKRRLKSVYGEAGAAMESDPTKADAIVAGVRHSLDALDTEHRSNNGWRGLVQDGAAAVAQDLPPLVQVIEGIICDRSKLVIVSSAKCFKTWLTIYLALCVSHGVPFLGRITIRRRILYVNLELKSATFDRRLKSIAGALGITVDPGWFHHLPLRGCMAGITVDELISRIVSIAKQLEIALVVIDPVAKANVEGEENSSRDQTLFFNQIDRLTTEAECTVVLNDHTTKGNQSEKDPLDTIRGSSAKGGDLDAAMVLRKHEVDGCYRVDMVHRELAPVDPFVMGWKFPLMELRPDLSPDAMKKAKGGRRKAHDPRDLIAFIGDNTVENPISISGWAAAAGIKRQTLSEYLPEMRVKGWVNTSGEGANARQYLTPKGQQIATRAGGDS